MSDAIAWNLGGTGEVNDRLIIGLEVSRADIKDKAICIEELITLEIDSHWTRFGVVLVGQFSMSLDDGKSLFGIKIELDGDGCR